MSKVTKQAVSKATSTPSVAQQQITSRTVQALEGYLKLTVVKVFETKNSSLSSNGKTMYGIILEKPSVTNIGGLEINSAPTKYFIYGITNPPALGMELEFDPNMWKLQVEESTFEKDGKIVTGHKRTLQLI